MRGLLALSIFLSALLSLIVASAITLGTPRPAALADLDACGLPCWLDISPRTTELTAARAILTAHGYREFLHNADFRFLAFDPSSSETACRVSLNYASRLVTMLSLSLCPDTILGDLISALGAPDGILESGTALTFRGGHVIAVVRTMVCDRWFAPDLPLLSVYLLNAGVPLRRMMATYTLRDSARAFAWRGFANEAYYARTEPDFPVCSS